MGRLGSWVLLQESQLFLAGQRVLLECFVCGRENGAIVSAKLPQPAEPPAPAAVQTSREAPVLPLPHGGLHLAWGVRWGKDNLLFQERGRPPLPITTTYTLSSLVLAWTHSAHWSWLAPTSILTCSHWKPVQAASPLQDHQLGDLSIPAPHPPLQEKKKQQACISFLVVLVLTP